MSFKKMMQEKGPDMVREAAREMEIKREDEVLPLDPRAIASDSVTKIFNEIQKSGKISLSVPISKIILDENVRSQFSQQSINELGESLKDVGLLHNIILEVVERNGKFYFQCLSGKRRVLAAETISWSKIDADIILGKDPIESLYMGAIANLHESVFWLDNALLYSKLNAEGHTDEQIASRVKVNVRTVGWFRRLAKMSLACQNLVCAHQTLFNSKWAQELSRHGELPDDKVLEQNMIQMIAQKRTWHKIDSEVQQRIGATSIDKSDAIVQAHRVITNLESEQLINTKNFLLALNQSGFITQSAFKKIQAEFFKETPMTSEIHNPEKSNEN